MQESKDNTNRLLSVIRQTGRLPEDRPTLMEGPIRVYSQDEAATLTEALGQHGRRVMRLHLGADLAQGLRLLRQAIKSALTGVRS